MMIKDKCMIDMVKNMLHILNNFKEDFSMEIHLHQCLICLQVVLEVRDVNKDHVKLDQLVNK